ncbi:MAG: OmpH family outer membrane protein [Bacteroidales bacterium]|nr:OmpH family outer membrane protein [Bacteroidales bacterium]
MNIKSLWAFSALLLSLSLAACKKAEKPETPVTTSKVEKTETKAMAYVEVDSLLTQYTFCIEQKAALETKSKQYEAQLAGKMSQIQKAMADFQQKMQNGGFTSQEQAQAAQQRVQRMQEEAARLEQSLTKKMAAEQEKFNNTLRDSVRSFLNDYNKAMRYEMILSKQGDNLLYANPKLDITKAVIEGMNKRYNKGKK